MLALLRVGADLSYGGFHSPIFPDRSYLFIPIPDKVVKPSYAITYGQYEWNGQSILSFIPNKIREKREKYTIHLDPEFINYTYGSPHRRKTGKIDKNYHHLQSMSIGDILAFYSAFKCSEKPSLDGYYIFAYFIVEHSITYNAIQEVSLKERERIQLNHHFLHGWADQIVIIGNKKESRIFNRAVLLSSKEQNQPGKNYCPIDEVQHILNYDKSLTMSSIRVFYNEKIQTNFLNYLEENSGGKLAIPSDRLIHSNPLKIQE